MGIKHFFTWFRNNEQTKQVIYNEPPQQIDHVLIDMNGIIHESAQFVFKYGKYSSKIQIPARLRNKIKMPAIDDLYLKIQQKVNDVIQTVNPRKSIYLAIDGVAPRSKQNQQRQRRFRAAMESEARGPTLWDTQGPSSQVENELRAGLRLGSQGPHQFDSNCITAGTKFMSDLSSNLKDLRWIKYPKKKIDVKISTDSEPGEGEHKLINWIRENSKNTARSAAGGVAAINEENEEDDHVKAKAHRLDDVYCVVGLDADLILLCCLLKTENVFIMRESEYSINYIDITLARKLLPISIDDLLLLSCFIGNDFLPSIPSLEIKESPPELGALDYFFEIFQKYYPKYYSTERSVEPCEENETKTRPLLVNKKNGHVNFKALKFIFEKISEREQNIMTARHQDGERFINEMWKGDIVNYRTLYHEIKLDKAEKSKIVVSYLKSAQWVYEYYSKGVPSWNWYYPYNYTLHADDFAKYCPLNVLKFSFRLSEPSHPHEQLLRVIPLSGKHLIPSYLHQELEKISKKSNTFKIDKAGKREDWEAVTIVDFVELPKIIYEK